MRSTVRWLALITAVGLMLGGGPAGAANSSAQCQFENPRWEVSWTSSEVDTLQWCGGDPVASPAVASSGSGSTDAAPERDELPVTTGPAMLIAGLAAALIGLGAGLYLVAHRRRTAFTV